MPAQTEKTAVNYYWAWTYTWAGTLDASQPVLHQAIFIRACPISAVSNEDIISIIFLKRLLNRWIIWTLTEKIGENRHCLFQLTGKVCFILLLQTVLSLQNLFGFYQDTCYNVIFYIYTYIYVLYYNQRPMLSRQIRPCEK